MSTASRPRSATIPRVRSPIVAASVPPPPSRPRKSKTSKVATGNQSDTFQRIFTDIYRALLTIPSNPTLLCTTIFTIILVLTHNADLTTGFLANLISGLEPNAALSIRTNAARIFGVISFIPVLMTRNTSPAVYITLAFGIFIAPPVNVYVYSFYSMISFLFLSIRNSHTRWFLVGLSVVFYFYFQSTVSSWRHPTSIDLPSNSTARTFRG